MSTNFTAPGAHGPGWSAKIRLIRTLRAGEAIGSGHSRVTAIRPIPVGRPTTSAPPLTAAHTPIVDDDPDDFGGHAS